MQLYFLNFFPKELEQDIFLLESKTYLGYKLIEMKQFSMSVLDTNNISDFGISVKNQHSNCIPKC